jgi:hypothetical protein
MVRHIVCFSSSRHAFRRQALEEVLFFDYQGPECGAEGLSPQPETRWLSDLPKSRDPVPLVCEPCASSPYLPCSFLLLEVDRSIEGSRRVALAKFHSGP